MLKDAMPSMADVPSPPMSPSRRGKFKEISGGMITAEGEAQRKSEEVFEGPGVVRSNLLNEEK